MDISAHQGTSSRATVGTLLGMYIGGTTGRYRRKYTTQASVSGRTQSTDGTACRQPDGS